MAFDLLKKWLAPPPPTRPFGAWQIELTTRCPLQCRVCTRSGFPIWHNRDMSIEAFRRLSPLFGGVQTVVLQGWGEPLLYPNLIDAVETVKSRGAGAGFVTSGQGLDTHLCRALIGARADFMGFSLGGATSATHNAIRLHSNLDTLLHAIGTLTRLKTEAKSATPRLHIAYLMIRDNVEDVPRVVDLAASLGVEEVFLIHLIHVTTEWQNSQRVFRYREEREKKEGEAFDRLMAEATARARHHRIRLRMPPFLPMDVGVCEENPLRNLYISVDGEVSPCVFLGPPTSSPFKRIFCGRESSVEKVSYGNVFKEDFNTLWSGGLCEEFRRPWALRKTRFGEIYGTGLRNPAQKRRAEGEDVLPAPPPQCRSCHKRLGF